ncbi:MAG: hypothetical protein RLZZ301_1798 [Bacteroidota bacterium]|jgi:RNA polymerase sigma-70 factor (ECF subfamily)
MIIGRRRYLKQLSDEELVAAFLKEGWNACIDEIYQRYAHLLFGVHLNYVKDVAIAEDLNADLFAQLREKLEKHEVTYLKAWLYTMARNNALMSLRKRKDQVHIDSVQLSDTSEEELSYKVQQEIEIDIMLEGIRLLKPAQRQCIELFYLQRKSYEQIMKETNFSFKEVKSYIQNGKRMLKNLIEQDPNHETNA